ncbi:uncharacterized protein ISCGN_028412 [Ixodes scapularis]
MVTAEQQVLSLSVAGGTFCCDEDVTFPGASTRTLPGEVERLHLHAPDFVAVYVGGNDLYGGDSAEAISSRIEELVTTLKGLTSHVVVFKLVPRGGPLGHAKEGERLSLNSLLVRKLVVLGVTIVNVDASELETASASCARNIVIQNVKLKLKIAKISYLDTASESAAIEKARPDVSLVGYNTNKTTAGERLKRLETPQL